MADPCAGERDRSLTALLLDLISRPARTPIPGLAVADPVLAPVATERHYVLTLTEGPWNDWFMSVMALDERGRKVAIAVDDQGPSVDTLLGRLLRDVQDAIVEDFVTRRRDPRWLEQRRRSLLVHLRWLRNLRRRVRRR